MQSTLREVGRCTREGIVINTFMLERSRYLSEFVDLMSRINRGRAFYVEPEHLGEYVLVDYVNKKTKRVAEPTAPIRRVVTVHRAATRTDSHGVGAMSTNVAPTAQIGIRCTYRSEFEHLMARFSALRPSHANSTRFERRTVDPGRVYVPRRSLPRLKFPVARAISCCAAAGSTPSMRSANAQRRLPAQERHGSRRGSGSRSIHRRARGS